MPVLARISLVGRFAAVCRLKLLLAVAERQAQAVIRGCGVAGSQLFIAVAEGQAKVSAVAVSVKPWSHDGQSCVCRHTQGVECVASMNKLELMG